MKNKNFLMLKDIAAHFGVSTGSVRNWIKSGKLAAMVTPGRHRRVKRVDFEAFLAQHRGKGVFTAEHAESAE
jgi:excisionase family DNA binding protein